MFAKVEICPFGHRTDKTGNIAHENWLKWSSRYPHLTTFKAKISHDKDAVYFNDENTLQFFLETWEHYQRRIY